MSRRVMFLLGVLAAVVLAWGATTLVTSLTPSGATNDGRSRASFLSGLGSGSSTRVEPERETVEVTDYSPPPPDPLDALLADDSLDDRKPAFDPDRVHPKAESGWRINLSDSVLRLDVPIVRPDVETHLTAVYPSYAEALKWIGPYAAVLPSVNLIDGKAKQFDDGLYAAVDSALTEGVAGAFKGHIEVVRALAERLGPSSPASPFLAAGLELAGVKVPVNDEAGKRGYLNRFESNPVQAKPIGFYTWNARLETTFRFLRFFQQPQSREVSQAISGLLRSDPELRKEYARGCGVYAGLTNPLKGWTNDRLASQPADVPVPRDVRVSLYPASTSKETELFEKLFPLGMPPDANLMRELIKAIRSGKVDLTPKEGSGWYDHQVHALETLLLPERGAEHERLLLTKSYKKRMLEAFQALMTKRRETHVRQLGFAAPTAAVRPLKQVKPRLRLEPNPTYYLRTARSYAFLAGFLEASLGPDLLEKLHGQTQQGDRPAVLKAELAAMRDLFYGFHIVSAEDIGMKPDFKDGEVSDPNRCRQAAEEWLAKSFQTDPDLKADTRVSVPVMVDLGRTATRLWVTLGVRWAKLDVSFAHPPRLRPEGEAGAKQDWTPAAPGQLAGSSYVIAVDEFAEVELAGLRTFTREELRARLAPHKTKDAMIKAFKNP
ncbi:MAG: hypothetical protein U0835_13045 [Isosphaeraceae bacterium]